MFRILMALSGALLVAACNPGAQLEDAQARIEQLHAIYNDNDSKALYRFGGDAFREAVSPEQADDLMALFHARLGTIKSTQQTSFNAGFNNGTATTTVVMETRFEQGTGTETFVFKGSGETMELLAWNVNSQRLEISPAELKSALETGEAAGLQDAPPGQDRPAN